MSTSHYPSNRTVNKIHEEHKYPKPKTTPNVNHEKFVPYPDGKKSKVNRYIPKQGDKIDQLIKYADEVDIVISKGLIDQYCVKGSDVILRKVYFVRNDSTKSLMITVDAGNQQTDNYSILFTKDICPYNFKDNLAFVIKVLDNHQQIKSMTFKTNTNEEKASWLTSYGIDIDTAQKLLECCIEEIEKRRFHLGIKKRHEDRNKVKVTPEVMFELINLMKNFSKVNLTNNDQWSVTSLERLIQILLNELIQPLIPYSSQRVIRKLDSNNFNAANETRKLLNTLPSKNRTMLAILLGHMERLSKYYLIIMSSPRKDLPYIRLNICQRLTPIIFRLQEDLDSEIILNRASDLLYHTMLCVNGASESSDI